MPQRAAHALKAAAKGKGVGSYHYKLALERYNQIMQEFTPPPVLQVASEPSFSVHVQGPLGVPTTPVTEPVQTAPEPVPMAVDPVPRLQPGGQVAASARRCSIMTLATADPSNLLSGPSQAPTRLHPLRALHLQQVCFKVSSHLLEFCVRFANLSYFIQII